MSCCWSLPDVELLCQPRSSCIRYDVCSVCFGLPVVQPMKRSSLSCSIQKEFGDSVGGTVKRVLSKGKPFAKGVLATLHATLFA